MRFFRRTHGRTMQDPVFEIQRLYPQVFLACHTATKV
jgi:hypothetical protein